MTPNTQSIVEAARMRLSAVPNEHFVLRVRAVAGFLNCHPDLVTGVLLADLDEKRVV